MVHIAFIYGEARKKGFDKIIAKIPSVCKVSVILSYQDEIDFERKVDQENMFNDPVFSRKLTDQEIIDAENWLGHSFYLALQYNYLFYRGYNDQMKKLHEFYELIAQMVIYFREFFTKNKVDVYSTYVASRLPFIISILVAKKLGVTPLNLGTAGTSQTFVIRDFDFQPIFWKPINEKDISAAKLFFLERYSKKKQENTDTLKENEKKFNILNYFASDVSRLFKKASKKGYRLNYKPLIPSIKERFIRQLRRIFVPMLLQTPDWSKKFLFFPLHHDEETHLSWGEHFLNQYDLMKKVSDSLPGDTLLYIKPHPSWLCTDAPFFEMKKLKALRNVRLIKSNISPVELIKKSAGVVTINSTTGIEAIIFEKPLLTFGHSFYAENGVAKCVRDLKHLQPDLEAILKNPKQSYDQKVRDVLLAKYHKHLIPTSVPLIYEFDFPDSDAKRVAEEMVAYLSILPSSPYKPPQ